MENGGKNISTKKEKLEKAGLNRFAKKMENAGKIRFAKKGKMENERKTYSPRKKKWKTED